MKYAQHPLSAAFPAMSSEDFQSLKDSIEAIGVQNPITLFEGMVIDGWHRYTAANEVGVECPSVELDEVDPRDFVLAQNKARRHITAAQLALATTEVYRWAPEGKPKLDTGYPVKTTRELADIAGVHSHTIKQAKSVIKQAEPEVLQAVKDGGIGLRKAAEIAKLPREEQAAAIAKPIIKEKKPEPEPVNHELEEAAQAINELAEENEKLRDRLAIEVMEASPEEKQEAAATIAELREKIRMLEIELDAVKSSRDGYQRQNSELLKQVQMQQRQLKKLGAGNGSET